MFILSFTARCSFVIESQDARRCYPDATAVTSSGTRRVGGRSTVIVRSKYQSSDGSCTTADLVSFSVFSVSHDNKLLWHCVDSTPCE